jgi:tetratricopeptide (TPR) repeat protein
MTWRRGPRLRGILAPLRNEPGPARPITEAQMDVLIEATLARSEDIQLFDRPRVPRVRRNWRVAALAVLAVGSVAAAGTKIVMSSVEIGPVHIVEHSRPVKVSSTPRTRRPSLVEELTRREVPAVQAPQTKRDLLIDANQLRQKKQWSRAEKAYAQVAQKFPGSDEAYTASIAAAALRLEHLDDADGALELYSSASKARRDGPLAEEALFGMAGAYRALGHRRSEKQALTQFLKRFPKSSMREQVEERMTQLEEKSP